MTVVLGGDLDPTGHLIDVVVVNLTGASHVLERVLDKPEKRIPRWFAYPMIKAGYSVHLAPNPFISVMKSLLSGRRVNILCFNPSIFYAILAILPLPVRYYSLYQWRPLGRLGFSKRLAIYLILLRSRKILVYERISERYIRMLLPSKHVEKIGLYTDTDFFDISDKKIDSYILVPGDHLRDEELLSEISRRTGYKIIRVTRNPSVYSVALSSASDNVEVLFDISFEHLLKLYQQASVVLILADSSEVPSGITTLCEALSCGKPVVVNEGHSSALAKKSDIESFLTIVEKDAKVERYVEVLNAAIESQNDSKSSSAREFAESNLSLKICIDQWLGVLGS